MSERFVRLVVPQAMLDELMRVAEEEKVTLSEPQPVDSVSEPLNAPMVGAEIMDVVQVVTAVFAAGTTIVTFADKLSKLIKQFKVPVQVVNARNAAKRERLDATTSPETIKKVIESV